LQVKCCIFMGGHVVIAALQLNWRDIMLKNAYRIIPLIVLTLISSHTLWAAQEMAIDPETCLGCHSGSISAAAFADSVHGKNGCNSCHVQLTDLPRHMKGEIKVEKVHCERCHKKENAEHYASVHIQKDIMCADCHTDAHHHRYWKKDKRVVVAKCIQCHDHEAVYGKSIHGTTVAAGNQDSAACNDCHNLHDIKALGNGQSHTNREFHTKVCMKCHSNEAMMKRNNVFNVAIETYMESYHGKNYRLGYPEKVAGCADCHTSHSVMKASDPLSSVGKSRIVSTCRQCHKHATSLFAKYYAHGEHTDRKKFPLLYWTFIGMTGLLAGTFAVMAFAGMSLDNLSLMALVVATGFVVDDAIVMIENIVRYIEQGKSGKEAAEIGARQIGFTVLSLTVSLVAVFLPLLLMPGVTGRLFHEFAWVLSIAVVLSMLISLTLTPMMCAYLLKPDALPEGELQAVLELVARHRGVEDAGRRAEEHVTRAAQSLAPFQEGSAKAALLAAARFAVARAS